MNLEKTNNMLKIKFVAVDSSSMIAYFQGQKGDDVDAITELLEEARIIIPPVVLCELLSDPKLPMAVAHSLSAFPALEITKDYWRRVAHLRSKLIAKKLKARLADSMIAQIWIFFFSYTKDKFLNHDFKHNKPTNNA